MGKVSVDQYLLDPAASQSQPRELQRVTGKIEAVVIDFCSRNVGNVFNIKELEDFVRHRQNKTSPGSGARILRKLRKEGRVQYNVVNRRQATYLVGHVKP